MKIAFSTVAAPARTRLACELAALFVALPLVFFIYPIRFAGLAGLWLITIYAAIMLGRSAGFVWAAEWRGRYWPVAQRLYAIARFVLATAITIIATRYLVPEMLFGFPTHKTKIWLIVMVLYPWLSALPQELIFRSFFFRRYHTLLPPIAVLILCNAFCFGFMHIVFHNWVSPVLSFIGSLLFTYSYRQHGSLKWAMIEHAAYGCMIFTVGIGFYFVGISHPP